MEIVKQAVERLCGCRATYRERLGVNFQFKWGAWTGMVTTFDVDHAEASICFAWSSPIEGSDKRRYYAVLKKPPIENALDAVRTSIVADAKILIW